MRRIGELSELACDQESDLLGDIDGVVANPLQCPRGHVHVQAPIELRSIVRELERLEVRGPVQAIDGVVHCRDPERKVVLRFPVNRDGSVGKSEVFIDMTAEVPGEEALDGLKVDRAGNLYVCAPDGLRIYSAVGKHLGTIIAPRPIHNAAWGEDGSTLYLTARDRLYRIALNVQGVRP